MMEDNPQKLINLSLPAALLSYLTQDEQLNLNHGDSKDGETHSLTIARGANGTSEKHALQVDEHPVDWYQTMSTSETNKKSLSRIGTTKHRYTLQKKGTKPKPILDTSTSNLKRIGAQTRKLLDEERKKRKEIVRLDDDELPLPPEAIAKEAATKTAAESLDVSETKAASKPKKPRVAKRKRNDPSIDSYMPNTDNLIAKAIGKEDKSYMIRLHGLPIGIRTNDIRKFFHGLNPTIFVLPTFDGYIDGWDAGDFDCRKHKVARYSETFRVYAKFQSVLVADAAMERLGESIGFDVDRNGCEAGVVGAAISLSPVSKHVAKFLDKYLVSQWY